MPRLDCSVQNCSNNVESCCSLNQIKVEGDHAETAQETCCNNFVEGSGASNSTAMPQENLEVNCAAMDCAHNSSARCCADSISVAGAGASNSVDTQCSSYCKQF